MLSILSNIKNKISDIINRKRTKRRLRNYHVVMDDTITSIYVNEHESTEPQIFEEPPPPSPVATTRLFNTEIDQSAITNDYEIQDLLRIMDLYKFDISNITLESRFETLVNAIPNASEISKIKIKLLYIIIANDWYRDLFEEKKKYPSVKVTQRVGVFRYNDYIIRIDDCPFSFMNESDVTKATINIKNDNIIRPFLIYMNIRHNPLTNDICECRKPRCECEYKDNVENETSTCEIGSHVFKKLRTNTISFSIQHYVKDSVLLYTWVRENISSDIYNRFLSIHRVFFVHLFYKCALLLRDIHSVNIVHGDIKPDNILICEHDNFNINHPERCKNFTVYLIDFGLSGFHKLGVGTGGTVPYCHPEFKNIVDTNRTTRYNWKKIDVKHDVWSLGISFLTMYIYRDFYNYYNNYPNYFFLKNGYVSSLIMDVISDTPINELFTKMMTDVCIPSSEVCALLEEMK